MKFLDIDGPLMQFLGKMADLMWLNMLTLICCLPVVTAGASLTALHYMVLKIVRNEEGYITKGFFKAFKENFRQSTVIWVLFLVVAAVLGTDYYILAKMEVQVNNVVGMLLMFFAVLTLFTFVYVFPLQAKFSNTVRRTIWNAMVVSVVQFPKTVLMIVLYVLPYVMLYLSNTIFPIVFVFCLSLPAFLSALLYNKFFLRMEEQILAQDSGVEGDEAGEDEDERIFRDEPDETLEVGQNN